MFPWNTKLVFPPRNTFMWCENGKKKVARNGRLWDAAMRPAAFLLANARLFSPSRRVPGNFSPFAVSGESARSLRTSGRAEAEVGPARERTKRSRQREEWGDNGEGGTQMTSRHMREHLIDTLTHIRILFPLGEKCHPTLDTHETHAYGCQPDPYF